jgi:hypothetical protein
MGPVGLTSYLAQHGRGASRELDAVCAQKDAHTALLYWFTDLPAAIAEARRTNRPILSLRLLGRLDEELSCANSRFFRKLLYPEPRINALMRDHFVLHWQSVRPVPKVTIDFGDGRKLERTLTGNSVHVILDPAGRPADALPGLFAPAVFQQLLVRAHGYAMADRRQLADLHRRALTQPMVAAASRAPRSVEASRLAPTKHMVELPTLRAVSPAGAELDHDTRTNLELHARVHHAFAGGAEWSSVDAMVARIYSDLFLMPMHDPALGLDVPDPFSTAAA